MKKSIYFRISIIGYAFGMILCAIAINKFTTAQPALLYLTPSIIFPILVYSILNQNAKMFFNGIYNN